MISSSNYMYLAFYNKTDITISTCLKAEGSFTDRIFTFFSLKDTNAEKLYIFVIQLANYVCLQEILNYIPHHACF